MPSQENQEDVHHQKAEDEQPELIIPAQTTTTTPIFSHHQNNDSHKHRSPDSFDQSVPNKVYDLSSILVDQDPNLTQSKVVHSQVLHRPETSVSAANRLPPLAPDIRKIDPSHSSEFESPDDEKLKTSTENFRVMSQFWNQISSKEDINNNSTPETRKINSSTKRSLSSSGGSENPNPKRLKKTMEEDTRVLNKLWEQEHGIHKNQSAIEIMKIGDSPTRPPLKRSSLTSPSALVPPHPATDLQTTSERQMMRKCIKGVRAWVDQVAAEYENYEEDHPTTRTVDSLDTCEEDIEESVEVERSGDLLIVHLRCPCRRGYKFLFPATNCYYSL